MKIEIPVIPAAERTPLVESLLAILDRQQQRLAQLEEAVQQLRDEIARLKGQAPRPKIAPSLLEAPAPAKPPAAGKRPGSAKRPRNAHLVIHQEHWLDVPDAPPGAQSKGYEPFLVQDLQVTAQVTRYWRQRVQALDGTTRLAPLPPAVRPGQHFGPGLIAFALYQHHHNGVTQPLLLQHLRDCGLDISAGQLHRLLTEGVEALHQEKEHLLPAALAVSAYIGVDDTAARHQGHNGYCTVLSNELFAFFQSTDSKSRVNFLEVLRGAGTAYVVNDLARAYWARQGLSPACAAQLSAGPAAFADAAAWQAWLARQGVHAERLVRIATEGALLGCLIEQGVAPDLVILSDGAGQFDVLVHAACWVHAERPLTRMVPYSDEHRRAIQRVQMVLWELYRDLKSYRQRPHLGGQEALASRFDVLVREKTGFPSIDGVLQEMAQHKADLLRVLQRPEVPLHNNATESDIREYVKKRKISGGTRSAAGRRCRDTFSSLKKTCRKLGVGFWSYLQDRIGRRGQIPRLAVLLQRRAQEKSAGNAQAVLA